MGNPETPPFQTPDSASFTTSDIGSPGQFPYTRGIQPTMYRGRPWTMRQYAGFGTAAESNRRYRYLLDQGVTGLSIAFDLPTQIGYDSDHPLARGEVGRVGVGGQAPPGLVALVAPGGGKVPGFAEVEGEVVAADLDGGDGGH